MDYDMQLETTDQLRARLVALGVVALLVLIALVAILQGFDIPKAFSIDTLIRAEGATPVHMFVAAFASGLFFLPVPIEVAFILGVRNGMNPLLAVLGTVAGFVLGHTISYLIGLKLSHFVRFIVSPKKLYGLRRKVNKYGSWAVLAFNLLPAPSPQLTFGLGIARYNMVRLIILVVLGNLVKYVAIASFLLFTGA